MRFTEKEVETRIRSVGRAIEDYIERFEQEQVEGVGPGYASPDPGCAGSPPSEEGGP